MKLFLRCAAIWFGAWAVVLSTIRIIDGPPTRIHVVKAKIIPVETIGIPRPVLVGER